MTSVSISVKGAEECRKNMDKFVKAADREVALRMTLIIRKIAADAKRMAPVDTGYLRSHINQYVIRKRTFIIGRIRSLAYYSAYQEFGAMGRNRPHPFMRPALVNNFSYVEKEIKTAVLSAAFKAQTTKGLGTRKITF